MDGIKTRILRPRTTIYSVLLLALVVGFGVAVAQRQLVAIDVMRDRNSLFRQLEDGSIENVYTVRLINKDTQAHTMRLTVQGLPGATLDSDRPEYLVGGGEIVSVAIRIRAPREAAAGSRSLRVVARSDDAAALEPSAEARFLAPGSGT
jgi:polyferredoxin